MFISIITAFFFNPNMKENDASVSAVETNNSSLCARLKKTKKQKEYRGEPAPDNPRLKMECKTPADLQREAAGKKETPVIFIRIV